MRVIKKKKKKAHTGRQSDFLIVCEWIIHRPYGRECRIDIGGFLRIRSRNFGRFRPKSPFATRWVAREASGIHPYHDHRKLALNGCPI